MKNLSPTIISFARALLSNSTPTEETTKVFINEYLAPKIKWYLTGKLPKEDIEEIPNDIYIESLPPPRRKPRMGILEMEENLK